MVCNIPLTLSDIQGSVLHFDVVCEWQFTYKYLLVVYLTKILETRIVRCQFTGRLMNDKLERVWKESVTVYLKLLPRDSPGGTEKNHGEFQSELSVLREVFERGSSWTQVRLVTA
jgi:hypothetical protein